MNQFLCALCVLCGLNLIAAPLQWTCDWPEAKSQTFSLYQGETATFEPTFRVNGRTVTNATIEAVWYQTNGMGNAWWKLDGATFAPSNDVGAAAYRFFVEARVNHQTTTPPNHQTIYRANGALRMLPSPGFTPNAIEPPIVSLDFANIEVANAPWTEIGERATGNGERLDALEPQVATNAANIASLSSQLSRVSRDATNYTDGVAASIRTEVGSVSNDVSTLSDTVATTSAEIAPAVTAYPRVYAFMTGSTNANFVVTNYQLTAEADAERTHFDPSDPDLDFSTVPSSLRLEDFSTGTNRVVVDARDWTVWYYACKIGSAIHTAYTTAVETCRAWAGFTATGLENPVPDTLIVDVPNIWLLADKTFEKHVAVSNACWVIRSKDTVMPISDNAQSAGGFLELTDAFGEPYIRFNKTESYFVDPQAEGITNTNGTWYVVYPTQSQPKGGANAVIEGSTTYPGKAVLKAEDDPDCPATITWTGGAGHWVMVAVPKLVGGVYPSKMFFGAVVEVQGQDYIEYLRPMSIPHLLVDGVKIAPQIPASHPTGTSITWKVVE